MMPFRTCSAKTVLLLKVFFLIFFGAAALFAAAPNVAVC